MNIRRFVAPDMRQALRDVRASLGADAVMLSSRALDDGVEVIAAVDYDDSLFAAVEQQHQAAARETPARPEGAGRSEAPPGSGLERAQAYADVASAVEARVAAAARAAAARSAEPRPAPRVAPPQPAPASQPPAGARPPAESRTGRPAGKAAPASRKPDPRKAERIPEPVAAELNDLRQLLEQQLASLAWNDVNRRRPAVARSLRELARLGIDPGIARRLVADTPLGRNPREAWRQPLKLLAQRLPLVNRDLADLPGIYAVVGPTGVGKTTTIAKIAARFVLRHGVQKLGLVSTDSYRIGARDQLMTFARILGTPMQVASGADEMRAVLDGMRHKRLVLIDTAGMSQRDVRLAEQFSTLRVRGYKIRTVLALSAAADRGNLGEALRAFWAARPRALIATKLDEAASLGPLLSLLLESRLPLAYIADGQRVPEDLHLAGPRRAWLVQQALGLAGRSGRKVDEDRLAGEHGGLGLVANG